MTSPEITLILPTLDRSDLIGTALSSIARQTHPSFEVLVVDDSSDDNTRDLVESYQDPRFRYHKPKQRNGFYRSCRLAIDLCKTPLIGFMGDDDEITPNYLETLHQGLRRPNTVAAYARSPWSHAGKAPFRTSKHEPTTDGGGPWGFLAHLRQPPGDRFARFWGLMKKNVMKEALDLRYLADEGGKPSLGRDFLILFHLCLQGRIYYTEQAEYRFLSHDRQVGRDRTVTRLGVFPQGRFTLEDNLVGYAYMIDRVFEELDRQLPDFPTSDKILFSYSMWEWYSDHAKGIIAHALSTHAEAIQCLGLHDVAGNIQQHSKQLAEVPLVRLNVTRPPHFPVEALRS